MRRSVKKAAATTEPISSRYSNSTDAHSWQALSVCCAGVGIDVSGIVVRVSVRRLMLLSSQGLERGLGSGGTGEWGGSQ